MSIEGPNSIFEPGEWAVAKPVIGRLMRVLFYAVLSYVLIMQNSYGVYNAIWLPLAIGALGAGSASARLGLYAIAALLLMAVVPLSAVQAFVGVLS